MTVRLGMIIPSSNTVVEEETTALLAGTPRVSVHYSRFKLTDVAVADPAAAYYDSGLMVQAGRLLADCRCSVVTWNGSSGGVVGFARERRFVAELEAASATPVTTAALSVLDAFRVLGVRRFGLVTLNPASMNERIASHFSEEGFECVSSMHRSDIPDNFAMAEVSPDVLAQSATQCARAKPDALTIFGTNTRGARIAAQLERELGLPVIDSVAAGLWGAMRRAGLDTRGLAHYGRLFELGRHGPD
jgi:maleate isomerase